MPRLLAALGALAMAMLVAIRASASVSAHLVYVRSASAESCPDEEGLRRAVKERVGYDAFFPWAKTTVVVEVSNDGHAFVAHVQLVDDHSSSLGTRDLRSAAKGCGGLIDAAALAISIALKLNAPTSPQPTHPRVRPRLSRARPLRPKLPRSSQTLAHGLLLYPPVRRRSRRFP